MADWHAPTLSDVTRPTSELESWNREKPQPSQGAVQWLRKINLSLYSGGGNDKSSGIELSQMRIDFRINKQTNSTPNYLSAKVYNLAPQTLAKIGQYKRVQLSAGYQANFGMIFDGTVVLYTIGKENPIDSYLEIIAGDADSVHNNVTVNLTFPPGTLPDQQCKTALKQAKVPEGHIDCGKGQQPTLRYTHFLGSLPRFLRNHTNATTSSFFFDDGKAYIIPITGYLPGEMVNLSPTTGLVGIPKVTPDGIEAICLMNPKLRLGGLVHIDAKLLSGMAFIPGTGLPYATPGVPAPFAATGAAFTRGVASVSPTGTYKIVLLNHYGDTRGNPWYSEVVCCVAGEHGEFLPGANWGTALQRSAYGSKGTLAAQNPSLSPPPPPGPPTRR